MRESSPRVEPGELGCREMARAKWGRLPRAAHKLQGRLLRTSHPHKLAKYLRKLSALPMTVEVLECTGVRETVKCLRQDQQVGRLARALAAQWKGLCVWQPKAAPSRQDLEESRDAEARGGRVLRPEGWQAWGFPRQKPEPGAPACCPQIGHPGWPRPQLPTTASRLAICHQSTGSNELRLTLAAPASPAGEASDPHEQGHRHCGGLGLVHGQTHVSGPDSGLAPPLCPHCYGAPQAMHTPAPAHMPTERLDQSCHCAARLAPGAPLRPNQVVHEEASCSANTKHSETPSSSGFASASLAHRMAFYESFRQFLSNNLDAIHDVSFIPDCVLQPVLDKCPPHQLRRIEACNGGLAEKTDHLWKLHCLRSFKDHQPEEQESWRDMYLRLEHAQAQRLQHVTNRIRMARALQPEAPQSQLIPMSSAPTPRRSQELALGGEGKGGGARGREERRWIGREKRGGLGNRRALGARGRAGGEESTRGPARAASAVAAGAAAAAAAGAAAAAEAEVAAAAAAQSEAAAAAAAAAAAEWTEPQAVAPASVLLKAEVPGAQHPQGAQISPSSSGTGRRGGSVSPAAQTQACAQLSPDSLAPFPGPKSRKPATKKIAPLMAKTLRDYKRICSRR